jgi:hypothetical protein
VYDVAMKDAKSKDGADFTQLLKEGKCAKVPAPRDVAHWPIATEFSYNDLTSAFGAKRKWAARQSPLPRSKMTHLRHWPATQAQARTHTRPLRLC